MKEQLIGIINDWKFISISCLLLGLAPFSPEPHVWGKLKWIIGGSKGMQLLDFLDFAWHSLPFIFLFRLAIIKIKSRYDKNKE